MSTIRGDGRIEQILALVTRLAVGELEARQEPTGGGDDLDAIIIGVNMLAEELGAARAELEERVRSRTADLRHLNHEVTELAELGSSLQACESRETAYAVIARRAPTVLADLSGTLYVSEPERSALARTLSWGSANEPDLLAPADCLGLSHGRSHVGHAGRSEPSCAHISPGTGDSMCIPIAARGQTIGVLHLFAGGAGTAAAVIRLTDTKQQLGVAVGIQIGLALGNIDLQHKLQDQAVRDPLTGLYNRHFLDGWLQHEANRAQPSHASLGVIMLDVDNFKEINDVHGHVAGDQVLTAMGDAIRDSVRAGDVPCRYGGEEFLILVTDISRSDLLARAENLRANVERLASDHELAVPAVTASLGVAVYPHRGESPTDTIRAADAALYAAKRAGRNRVIACR